MIRDLKRVLPRAFAIIAMASVFPARQGVADALAKPVPSWLTGCWEFQTNVARHFEMWTPVNGGMMVGARRSWFAGRAAEYGQVLMRPQGAQVRYVLTSSQRTLSFLSTTVTDSSLVLQSQVADGVHRIIYRLRGPDSLLIRFEQPGPSGTRSVGYAMARKPCPQ